MEPGFQGCCQQSAGTGRLPESGHLEHWLQRSLARVRCLRAGREDEAIHEKSALARRFENRSRAMKLDRLEEIRHRLKDDSLNDAENHSDLLWCLDQLETKHEDWCDRGCDCGAQERVCRHGTPLYLPHCDKCDAEKSATTISVRVGCSCLWTDLPSGRVRDSTDPACPTHGSVQRRSGDA